MKTKGITIKKLPEIPESEMNSSVANLVEAAHERDEIIAILLDEIARLKKHNDRPKAKPSKLENDQPSSPKKKPGKSKKKTKHLSIQKTEIIQPEDIPEGSTFKDYRPFTVQDIEIKLNNVRYGPAIMIAN